MFNELFVIPVPDKDQSREILDQDRFIRFSIRDRFDP